MALGDRLSSAPSKLFDEELDRVRVPLCPRPYTDGQLHVSDHKAKA